MSALLESVLFAESKAARGSPPLKLYDVTVTFRALVLAESEAEATSEREVAALVTDELGSGCAAVTVTESDGRNLPPGWTKLDTVRTTFDVDAPISVAEAREMVEVDHG